MTSIIQDTEDFVYGADHSGITFRAGPFIFPGSPGWGQLRPVVEVER